MARTPSLALRSNSSISAGRERRPTEVTVSTMPVIRINLTMSAVSKKAVPCASFHQL
jgi:hypothetical protein